jgi:hypothetical protein
VCPKQAPSNNLRINHYAVCQFVYSVPPFLMTSSCKIYLNTYRRDGKIWSPSTFTENILLTKMSRMLMGPSTRVSTKYLRLSGRSLRSEVYVTLKWCDTCCSLAVCCWTLEQLYCNFIINESSFASVILIKLYLSSEIFLHPYVG